MIETAPSRGTRPTKPVKPVPLTRESLDSRTNAAKLYDKLLADIIRDLGEQNINAARRILVEAYVGVSLRISDMNVRNLMGQHVNIADLNQTASTLMRLASRIGVTHTEDAAS